MKRISYDLHIHSCLSPCGDNIMTPQTIVGIGALLELDVMALTDHNSLRNTPAFLKACDYYGILGIPGVEVTTSEEVHVVCLFEELKDALLFNDFIDQHLQKINNNEEIFGEQLVVDEFDQIIKKEPYLLINATNISVDDIYDIVREYNGVIFPAHIDKGSNSLLSNLGFVPENNQFKTFEIKKIETLDSLLNTHKYLKKCKVISNSDAHQIEQINEAIHFMEVNTLSRKEVLNYIDDTYGKTK